MSMPALETSPDRAASPDDAPVAPGPANGTATAKAVQTPAPRRTDRGGPAAARWAAIVLLGAAAAAAVAQPAWPLALARNAFWIGGLWRPLLVPATVIALLAVVIANTIRPGAAWRSVGVWTRLASRLLPLVLAALVGVVALAYNAGLVTASVAGRALFLLALQIGLFPGTPIAALLLLITGIALCFDYRGWHAAQVLGGWWRRQERPRGVARQFLAGWPALVSVAGAGLIASAVFPHAMQGWAHTDRTDAQRYSFYSSFFNFAISDDRIEQNEGYALGKSGLTLKPGASGSITFGLERTPDSTVLLKANFYNRRFDAPTGAPTPSFSNALEVSTDQGRSYRVVLADTSVGEVIGNAVYDLTPALGDSRSYKLRFRAINTTTDEVIVLPSIVVSAVVDPAALPHPTFPVVPYIAAVGWLAYVVGRVPGASRGRSVLFALAAAAAVSAGAAWAQVAAQGLAPHVADLGGLIGPFDPTPDASSTAAVLAARLGAALAFAAAPVALFWRVRPGDLRGPPAAQSDRFTGNTATDSALRGTAARAWSGSLVPLILVGCTLVGLVAVDARWQQLMAVRYEFLLPDAQGYQAIAETFPSKLAHYEGQRSSPLLEELYAAGYDGRASVPAVFYAGGNNGREPLWPVTLRLVYDLLGVSTFHTRLTSLLLASLGAALTCWFGWRILHPLVGLTGGLLVALNRPQIMNSVGGLREELVTVLFVLLIGTLHTGALANRRPRWWRVLATGVVAGAVVLVRADMVVLAGMMITIMAAWLRWPWPRWIAALVVMGVLAGPMYVGYAFTHGDAFYPGTYGATVNRNLEFPERMGTPGFPTPEEYAANWAAGPKISPAQYFFGYHTIPQFIAYSLQGMWRIFAGILFERQPVQLWLFLAGMGLLLLNRRWLVPGAVIIALMPFYAFMAGVPNPWVFAPRYAHHALPYAALAAAYGVWVLPLWLARRPWRSGAAQDGGNRVVAQHARSN